MQAGIAFFDAAIRRFDQQQPFRQPQGIFHTVGQAVAQVIGHHQAIHHHLNGVRLGFGQGGQRVIIGIDLAIDTQALIALAAQILHLLFVFALTPADNRGNQQQFGAHGQMQDVIDHLADGLAFDRQTRGGGVRHARPREQQAQIVINLRHRPNR